MQNRIALLIPVYNDQEGLNLSISKLPGEVPLDIVVVDDGSQPPIVLPDIPPPHQGYLLRLAKNQGIEHALNHGLKWILERGYEYIARLDAGDIALPGRFLKQQQFLDQHPEYVLVGGQAHFVDGEGRDVFEEHFPETYAEIRRFMHARCCFIHPAVMLRASVLRDVGLYSDRFKAAEDYELFFRIVRKYKAANLPHVVVITAWDPQGISLTKRRAQVWSRIRIMLHYFEPGRKESWLGILKNLPLLVLPLPWVISLKRRLKRFRGWL